MNCRFCSAPIQHLFLSLGSSPLSNTFIPKERLQAMEPFYPLEVYVCQKCFLVQLREVESPETIFANYAYFSSYSDTWLSHCQGYVNQMIAVHGISPQSLVMEVASNDGYLLQYFVEKGIPVLGIEPARNVAKAAVRKGIPTEMKFFGTETAKDLARRGKFADLLIGNNVLAHVPSLNDFVMGMKIILKPSGIITLEFPHLLQLIKGIQFDTIYHEHFSYFSFLTAERVFQAHGLVIFDVEELSTHGGSLRIYVCHAEDGSRPITGRVLDLRRREIDEGCLNIDQYSNFAEKVKKAKREFLRFLMQAQEEGKRVVGYGAPAKGNTLLNYCGVKADLIEYTVDRNPNKQGRYLPGSRIPIEVPERIMETKPDYLLILPWNLKKEIMEQMSIIRTWGGKFVIPIPEVTVYT